MGLRQLKIEWTGLGGCSHFASSIFVSGEMTETFQWVCYVWEVTRITYYPSFTLGCLMIFRQAPFFLCVGIIF